MIIKGLDLDDLFLLSEIIDKMELQIDVDRVARKVPTGKVENVSDVKKLGKDVVVGVTLDLMNKFIRNIHKAKNEVKQLIGNLTGMNQDAVSKMGMKQTKDFFTELFAHEDFRDFLSQAGASTGQK